ncbi:hypothetical protein BDZ94DRAFT_1278829 [Collybia nuda]|uniref:Uncharacterized protein n=1 Tax=Collybia nuda TaxID=64659 RepID=A0A9P5YL88_9AGAR|nr:hypothetical protein BDZ94DRAFT_1278829 [Collybia nuda]
MFIPFVSTPKPTELNKRKGGGGSFKGVHVGGFSKPATAYGSGGGPTTLLPITTGPAPNFGGRYAGGGDRKSVYGSRTYGSGYPGTSGRGVNGRGFPFFFWPIVWVGVVTPYLYSSEYGLPGSNYRPGGALMSTAFKSGSTGTIYRVIADNETTTVLCQEIDNRCHSLIVDSNVVPVSNTSDSSQAQPEQALQYYRASSVVLTLDNYNNSATFGPEGTPDTQLPTGIDTALLECLNSTIGEAVPLVESDHKPTQHSVWDWVLVAASGLLFFLTFMGLCISGILCELC